MNVDRFLRHLVLWAAWSLVVYMVAVVIVLLTARP
jgi:hypothetical protein